MRSKSKILLVLSLILFAGFFAFVYAQASCQNHSLSGYAWSSNIGWISFSCKNDITGGAPNYGVDVDLAGLLSGYAWSSNIGWIGFNQSDLSGCPSGTCEAKLASATGQVSGWARAVAGIAGSGGWDGWIKLRGTNYGALADAPIAGTCDWSGYAWGGDDNSQDAVTGWVNFKGTNYGVKGTGSGCGSPSAYNLSVAKSGSGTGVVTGDINGNDGTPINCGADCDDDYASGASVVLTAAPDTGSTFANWSGDCSGTLSTCAITMNANKAVSAIFNSSSSSQCSDGVDNDGDGLIDFPADPGCSSASDNDERTPRFREI